MDRADSNGEAGKTLPAGRRGRRKARLRTRSPGPHRRSAARQQSTLPTRPRVGEEPDRFFNLTLDLLCIAGFDGYFKRLNPAWEKTLGYTAAELLARPYIDFVHPDDRQATLAEARKLTTGALTITFENRYRCKDGAYKWLLWNAMPLPGQGLIYATARDITDRKQTETALRKSEERTRLIVERAYDAFVAIDANGLITDWNAQAESLFGWSRAEALGRSLADTLIPARHREAHYRGIEHFLTTGDGPILNKQIEMPALHRDGHEIPVELSVTPLRWGDTYTFYAFLRDISERQALERAKEEFFSMVGHELRTPLTSIRGALSLLAGGRLGPLNEKSQHMLEIAVQDTDRLIRLVNDILDSERLRLGKFTLVKQTCDAARLVFQAAGIMRPMAEKAGVTLSVHPEPAPLWADPDRLLQTLSNLLSNAIKFSSPGGTVWVTAARQGDQVLFQVKDQGRGIPADTLETIFERYRQVQASDSREKGGAGLGLFISRGIVLQHEGRLWAESAPGQGSAFSFTLPVRKEDVGGDSRARESG